jgi:hypothetical protein
LIEKHNLTFPFIVKKTNQVQYAGVSVAFPIGQEVVIMRCIKTPDNPTNITYIGYVDSTKYHIVDSCTWELVEASGPNVLSLLSYKKFIDKTKGSKR